MQSYISLSTCALVVRGSLCTQVPRRWVKFPGWFLSKALLLWRQPTCSRPGQDLNKYPIIQAFRFHVRAQEHWATPQFTQLNWRHTVFTPYEFRRAWVTRKPTSSHPSGARRVVRIMDELTASMQADFGNFEVVESPAKHWIFETPQ